MAKTIGVAFISRAKKAGLSLYSCLVFAFLLLNLLFGAECKSSLRCFLKEAGTLVQFTGHFFFLHVSLVGY